jgi:WD40 repeat protein
MPHSQTTQSRPILTSVDLRRGKRCLATILLCLLAASCQSKAATEEITAQITDTDYIVHLDWLDEDLIGSVAGNGEVRIWRAESLEVESGFHVEHPVIEASFSPDGTQVVLAEEWDVHPDQEAQVSLWDTHSGQLMGLLSQEQSSRVYGVDWSPDGTLIAWQDYEATHIYDVMRAAVVQGITDDLTTFAWSPDGQQFAIGTIADTLNVVLYDRADWQGEVLFSEDGDHIQSIAYNPDGSRIAVVMLNSRDPAQDDVVVTTLIVFDLATGQDVYRLSYNGLLRGLRWSPDGSRIAAGFQSSNPNDDYELIVWNAATGTEIQRLVTQQIINALAWSPDGMLLASGAYDLNGASIMIWDMKFPGAP